MSRGQAITFSNDGYAAVQRGLAAAKWIVITHEHKDHAGGIVKFETPIDLVGRLQLTPEQLGDGREVLFLGDVAWHLDQIKQLWYRPRVITNFLVHENRAQVMGEFRALYDLMNAEPALTLPVSHGVAERAALIESGPLGEHFEFP